MKRKLLVAVLLLVVLIAGVAVQWIRLPVSDTSEGWVKFEGNPVLGGKLGTVFDISVLKEDDIFRMWFSWRPKSSVALVESNDGIHWGEPIIVLGPNEATGWEDKVNRPIVVKRPDGYHMWYTGQANKRSYIGHAISPDGKTWTRTSDKPVLAPDQPWEKEAVMVPHVLWDEDEHIYKMWYSGGEQYEPDAIGYAVSSEGQIWSKRPEPVFLPSQEFEWESYKVTGGQIMRYKGWYYMFYIGFRDVDHAQIGLARSQDGISDWQRHPANPIIGPGTYGAWDHDAVYKPFAILNNDQWYLWYNGRRRNVEQIGLAIHKEVDLGFDSSLINPSLSTGY
jgi:beta-1,2-mannobiose phosphorylase / 1,2-beta-oligomannan phosphorylase